MGFKKSWLAAALGLIAIQGAVASDHAASPAAKPHGAHWSYKGPTGPAKWAAVDEKFGTCSLGQTQSPIDIRADQATAAALPAIQFDYKPSPLKIIDNGHTVQVNIAPGSSITVESGKYELLQFHFHKPSEERLNGKAYDMVAHLVHKNEAGQLAVVGVLLERGAKQALLQAVFDNLPKAAGQEVTVPGLNIDLNALLPENRGYYTFAGSLTTPPCSEGVTWFVLRNPVQLAPAQIAQFGRRYAMNARPVQPLNGRTIRVSP